VPIIKAESSEGVRLDICLNTDDGPKAAAWLSQQCEAFPVLRPLCLVVRGLLAEQRLADAATGGLSNWALCSMVLALLLEQQKASLPVSNAGHLLLGFLKYYG
jgi:non-canonical poly(A) RNA polymerase PAPD5/7